MQSLSMDHVMQKPEILELIPQEMLVEILSRLPLQSLHKFKWVSKSWGSLITGEILARTLSTPLLGFFYSPLNIRPLTYISIARDDDDDDTAVDPELSFLPRIRGGFRILDCCNGLVLATRVIWDLPIYVVCNPFTKSWTELPQPNYVSDNNFIVFDPSVSPHYKVVGVCGHPNENGMYIYVYCSERGRWERKSMNTGDCVLSRRRFCALWDGDLYVYAYCKAWSSINGLPCRGWQTLRIGLSGGDDDIELIKFPMGVKRPPGIRLQIGRLGDGKLCAAGLEGLRLWVWTLPAKGESEWVLEHDSTIIPGFSGCDSKLKPLVVGFHPLRNVLLLLYNLVIFAYDLEEMSLVELFRIEKAGEELLSTSVFPFVPCLYDDMLENRNPSDEMKKRHL